MASVSTVHAAVAGDAPWQRAVREYVERLRAHYGERLSVVVLYGSRARGDADEEGSDVDLLVVLSGDFDDPAEQQACFDLVGDIEEKYDYPLLCGIVATERDYRERMLPLFMNVRREGIEVWSAGKPKRVREEPPPYEAGSEADLELVMQHARRSLLTARELVESDHYAAANRAYYAMFHAATALLLSEGLAFSRHRGVIGAFNARYVKTKKLPAALGSALDGAFRMRNAADYSYREPVAPADVKRVVAEAGEFVAASEALLGLSGEPS
jgi:uncharacterized protein (UPF0332 family)/predicted nucleotidyltransferase